MTPSTYEADKDPTGEFLTANWSSMSEREKDAALKAWNEDYNRRNPYVPTPNKPIDWNGVIISAAFVGALVYGLAEASARVWTMIVCICCLAWRVGSLEDRIQNLESKTKPTSSAVESGK